MARVARRRLPSRAAGSDASASEFGPEWATPGATGATATAASSGDGTTPPQPPLRHRGASAASEPHGRNSAGSSRHERAAVITAAAAGRSASFDIVDIVGVDGVSVPLPGDLDVRGCLARGWRW
jgi:hypothetical protein